MSFPLLSFAQVRAALLARDEIALLDVREEGVFATGHPLWAANLPLSRIELDAWGRIPRRETRVVLLDDGEGLVATAARRLQGLGYTQVHLLAGGLAGWREAGGELFIDVNVPSKSFGELVESQRHTPSLSAQEVQALLQAHADVVVLDARRFDEYQTMNIPGSTSVPGGELVLRARELAPDPHTRIVVNCAGRTRSIIGTQSLVNAGLPNPVVALRNGTIGWTLAGQTLEHGAGRRFPQQVHPEHHAAALAAARALARRAGVQRLTAAACAQWQQDPARTTYCLDVRTPEEYSAGHLPGFRNAPGGQLVQETDFHAPVRGARFVLADGGSLEDGVRAAMAASWLAQMGWEVAVLEGHLAEDGRLETGPDQPPRPESPPLSCLEPRGLADALAAGDTRVIDVGPSAAYAKGHVPGAWWAMRSQLAQALSRMPTARRTVVTCGDGSLAAYAAADLVAAGLAEVHVLQGGTQAWQQAGFSLETGEQHLASARVDRYRRPYEGTGNAAAAMQAYLDWEFGLVDQLARDGTHHFSVLPA